MIIEEINNIIRENLSEDRALFIIYKINDSDKYDYSSVSIMFYNNSDDIVSNEIIDCILTKEYRNSIYDYKLISDIGSNITISHKKTISFIKWKLLKNRERFQLTFKVKKDNKLKPFINLLKIRLLNHKVVYLDYNYFKFKLFNIRKNSVIFSIIVLMLFGALTLYWNYFEDKHHKIKKSTEYFITTLIDMQKDIKNTQQLLKNRDSIITKYYSKQFDPIEDFFRQTFLQIIIIKFLEELNENISKSDRETIIDSLKKEKTITELSNGKMEILETHIEISSGKSKGRIPIVYVKNYFISGHDYAYYIKLFNEKLIVDLEYNHIKYIQYRNRKRILYFLITINIMFLVVYLKKFATIIRIEKELKFNKSN